MDGRRAFRGGTEFAYRPPASAPPSALHDDLPALDHPVEVDDDSVSLHLLSKFRSTSGASSKTRWRVAASSTIRAWPWKLPALTLVGVAIQKRELRVLADVLREALSAFPQPD